MMDSNYDVKRDELRKLMALRGPKAVKKIKEQYGNIEGLCQKLHASPLTVFLFFDDLVPADGVILDGAGLTVDDPLLSYTHHDAEKSIELDPMLLAETLIKEGEGQMVVTAVGANSQATIAMAGNIVRKRKERMVLENKLTKLAAKVGIACMSLGILTFLVLVVRFSVVQYGIQKEAFRSRDLQYFVKFLIIGVTVFKVAIPEGVPLLVTLAMAYSIKKMMVDNVLVRHLYAAEAMGSAWTVYFGEITRLDQKQQENVKKAVYDLENKAGIIVQMGKESVHPGGIKEETDVGSMGTICSNRMEKDGQPQSIIARRQKGDKISDAVGCVELGNELLGLRKSDVGVAMARTGSEAVREAADIILTNDNCYCIVKSVIWGRHVYDTICKILQYQLTVSIVASIVAFVAATVIEDSPLKPIQMVWATIIITLASLALVTDSPTDELLLNRKPHGRLQSLISRKMLIFIFGHVIYQLIVLFVLIFHGYKVFPGMDSGLYASVEAPPSQHFTMIFTAFVMMTLFNQINARNLQGERNVFKGLFTNPAYCAVWAVTIILQVLLVQFGGFAFFTAALNVEHWLFCTALGVGQLLWGQVLASIPSKIPKTSSMAVHNAEDNVEKQAESPVDDIRVVND